MTVQTKVMSAVLKLVEKQRDGETIDAGLIKKVAESFGMPLLINLKIKIYLSHTGQ
jgi:hypothetical protein